MADLVAILVRVNLVVAVAILAVIAARPAVRAWFGPDVAYAAWIIPLTAAFGTLLPAREVIAAPGLSSQMIGPSLASPLLTLWLAGAAGMALWVAAGQMRFMRRAQRREAGPAVVGLLAPRLLMPPDDGFYTPEERALIRAHERQHIARGDHRANALLAALTCFFWFNPLVHLAARLARLDQELACDAAVVAARRSARATYARALLKTQMSREAPPLGAGWTGGHPLELRVSQLAHGARLDAVTGFLLIAFAAWGAAASAWAVQPPTIAPPDLLAQRTAEGPPCPLARTIATPPHRPLRAFDYQGASFAWRSGYVSCVALSEGLELRAATYGVCQFDKSALIGVTAGGRTVFYAPGVGQRATVQVRGGAPSCTVGGWYAG